MAFKVMYRGLEVACESVEEIDVLADRMQGVKNNLANWVKQQDPAAHQNPTGQAEVKEAETSKKRGRPGAKRGRKPGTGAKLKFVMNPNQPLDEQYLSLLGVKQKDLLTVLAKAPDGMTDTELRNAFGLGSNMVLAGIMSNIYKMGNKINIGDEIITREILVGQEGHAYRYRATDYGKGLVEKIDGNKLF